MHKPKYIVTGPAKQLGYVLKKGLGHINVYSDKELATYLAQARKQGVALSFKKAT